MHTFGSLATPHTYLAAPDVPSGPLVGRLVANTEFLRALVRHGSFQRLAFFVGETREVPEVQRLAHDAGLPPNRLLIRSVLELPASLRAGELSVLHHASHVDQFVDLVALRDAHATQTVPVTGQIHSLSYPRLLNSHVLSLLNPPTASDAIFCSSHAGREALQRSFAAAARHLRRGGDPVAALACELPVVPLGIDVDGVRGGDRHGMRRALGVPDDGVILLVLGRFSEHDKMDLLPLLGVAAAVMARAQRPVTLVLAGARQGNKTPELLTLWSQALGIADRVRVMVDVTDGDKRDLLAAADVFVSPSDNVQETFGLAVIEAMAAGLPVVVSDFDGYRDTVDETVGVRVPTRWASDPGWLSAYGSLLYERPLHLMLGQSLAVDLPALQAALLRLVGDDLLRAALGARAAVHARSRFDWRTVIASYEAVWRRLAARPHQVPTPNRGPLGMDHGRIFEEHPSSAPAGDGERVQRSALSRALTAAGVRYPVYPDLKNLIGDAEINGVLETAEAPVSLGELREAARQRFAGDPLADVRADFLVGWLMKHGLLE